MRQRLPPAALCSLLAAMLCAVQVLPDKIVFPEVNQQPVTANSADMNTVPTLDKSVPSPCVWAILSCCQPGDAGVRGRCFELLGCGGQFWDVSPCSAEVTWAAASAASSFYS